MVVKTSHLVLRVPDFPQCHCKLTSKPLLERLATFLCCCFLDWFLIQISYTYPVYSNWKHTQASIWMYVPFNFPTSAVACTSCIVNTKLISVTQSPNSSWLPRPQQVQDASEEQYGSKHLRIHPQQKSLALRFRYQLYEETAPGTGGHLPTGLQ